MWLPVAAMGLLLGLFCGIAFGLAGRLRVEAAQVAQLAALSAAALGFALLSGLAAWRPSLPRAFIGGLIGVGLGLLCGIAFALGLGLAFALTYKPPCEPHQFCLDPGRWYGLLFGLIYGPAIGLWLGTAVWLALGLSLALLPPVMDEV